MIPTVSYGSNFYGVLAYNNLKAEAGKGEVLWTQGLARKSDGGIDLADCLDTFRLFADCNPNVRKPVIHFSLSPAPEDNLSDGQMAYIAHEFMERMGYGDQPYIVFLHEDTGRRHLHIVSVRVDEEGHELPYRFDLKRAMAHCREMERKYGLRPPQAGKTTAETLSSLRKVEYPSDDFTTRLRSTARAVIESYRYHSLGELNTVLELFNIRIEEIRGQHAGQEFHGLVYGVLDDNDRRIGPTVKASRLGPAFGWKSVEKRIARNTAVLKANPHSLDTLRSAVLSVRAVSSSEEEFVRQLRKQGIEAIFRRTDEGRIYGATFIDRTEHLAVNGSRLGREFAARAWDEWSDGFRPEPVSDTVLAQERSGCPNFRMEEVPLGMPQQQLPSLFEELLSAGAETFGELFEPLPPRHEEYIDPAFRLDYKKRNKKKRKHLKL